MLIKMKQKYKLHFFSEWLKYYSYIRNTAADICKCNFDVTLVCLVLKIVDMQINVENRLDSRPKNGGFKIQVSFIGCNLGNVFKVPGNLVYTKYAARPLKLVLGGV